MKDHGQASSTHLNGRINFIVRAPRGSDRVGIRFDDDAYIKGIRCGNFCWDYSDTFLGTVQREYGAIWHIHDKQFLQLMDLRMPGTSELTLLEVICDPVGDVYVAVQQLCKTPFCI